jgi:hypothetical protein
MHRASLPLALVMSLSTLACAREDDQDDTGLRVSAAMQVRDDIGSLEFRLTPAKCVPGLNDGKPADPIVYGVDITMMAMPDGSSPFDAADDYDASMVADGYLPIPPGCYQFLAAPLAHDGTPLPACRAQSRAITVVEGFATDLDVLIECGDTPRPEVTTNTPPTIESITLSSEVSPCEATRICVRASDPDHDMLEVTWDTSALGSDAPALVGHWLDEDRALTQCIVVQADEAGSYALGVTVHDVTRVVGDDGTLSEPMRVEDITGVESQADDAVMLDATLGCAATGRSAVVMLTLSNEVGMAEADARTLIGNLVAWTWPDATATTRVALVLDDAHHGEDVDDFDFVGAALQDHGYTVTKLREGAEGLDWAAISTYDVVWFMNPGHPIDDAATQTALLRFRNAGGGLVLQGDDMARFWGAPALMEPLTYLEWQNNGTVACGRTTDNDSGANYSVGFASSEHPILTGLGGLAFEYGNDIDHSVPLERGEEVLAWARFSRGSCSVETPVVVALDPDALLAWGE